MSYRGDEEALRARAERLERELESVRAELESAHAEIARLRGDRSEWAPGTELTHSAISGGPSRYARERTRPHTISDRGYEAIADVLRQRLGLTVTQVGRTLRARDAAGADVFSLTATDTGATRIRIDGDWPDLATSVVAIGGLTTTFGTLATLGVLVDLITHGVDWYGLLNMDTALTMATLSTAVVLAGSSTFLARRRAGRLGRERLAKYRGTFEAILALADEHAVRADAPKTRVAETPEEATPEASQGDEGIRPRRASG